MDTERWTAEQCAAHAGINTSTWRDYVSEHRAPTSLPGYDPDTGRKTWDATTVRTWHTHRAGQGARTDLTYLPDPDGRPLFISPTTITVAQLLLTLADPHTTTTTRTALRQRWIQELPEDNQTPRPGTTHTTDTRTTRRITSALTALEKLSGIHRDRQHITITDHAVLTQIATLP